jgi:hemerythrin-like domain-containing protein
MDPVTVLLNEHRVIERVLGALEAAADHLDAGGSLRPEFFPEAIAFLTEFADRRHHHKEEDLLFPALVRAGLPGDGGPVAVMLHEHDAGRQLIATMRRAAAAVAGAEATAAPVLAEAARAYAELLRHHIAKEDQVLFPMAGQVLSPGAASGLAAAFDQAVDHERSADPGGKYLTMADALEREAGRLAPPAPIW